MRRAPHRGPGGRGVRWGVVALGVVAAGAALRFWNLGGRAVWFDEAQALLKAGRPTAAEVLRAPMRLEPVGHALALHAWRRVAGDGVAASRAFAALCATAALAAAWFAARAWLNPAPAAAATALLALSPNAVIMAQQARPYALVCALQWAGLWLLARVAGGRAGTAGWAGWALLNALAGLAHYVSWTWVPAQVAMLALAGAGRRTLLRAAAWGAASGLPVAAAAVVLRGAVEHSAAAVTAADRPGPAAFGWDLVRTLCGSAYTPAWLLPVLAAAALALAGTGVLAGFRRTRRGAWPAANAGLAALLVVPPALLFAAERLGAVHRAKPRYALAVQLPFFAACARGAWALAPSPLGRGAALAALLAAEGAGTLRYLSGRPPAVDLPPYSKPLDLVAAEILAHERPGDRVVSVNVLTALPLRFYLPARLPQSYVLREPQLLAWEEAAWGGLEPIDASLAAAGRIWLVVMPVRHFDPVVAPAALRRRLQAVAGLAASREFPGVRLELWERRGARVVE